MAERLHELKVKRGQVKSKLTRFRNFVDSYENEPNLPQLKVRHERIVKCFDEFDEIQSEIELVQEQSDEENEREVFENSYFEVVAKAETILKSSSSDRGETDSISSRLGFQ